MRGGDDIAKNRLLLEKMELSYVLIVCYVRYSIVWSVCGRDSGF